VKIRSRIVISHKKPQTKYEKIMTVIFGTVFLSYGLISLKTNIPRAFNGEMISYTYHSYSSMTGFSRTWQQPLPSYAGVIFSFGFVLAGLFSFIQMFSKSKKVIAFSASILSVYLGLMLFFLFQNLDSLFRFAPLVFSAIGFLIIWHTAVGKK